MSCDNRSGCSFCLRVLMCAHPLLFLLYTFGILIGACVTLQSTQCQFLPLILCFLCLLLTSSLPFLDLFVFIPPFFPAALSKLSLFPLPPEERRFACSVSRIGNIIYLDLNLGDLSPPGTLAY